MTFATKEGREKAIDKVVRARQVDDDVPGKRGVTWFFDPRLLLILVASCFALSACAMSHPAPALTNLINQQVAAMEVDLEEASLMNRAELLGLLKEHLGTFYVLRYSYLGTAIPPEFSEVMSVERTDR